MIRVFAYQTDPRGCGPAQIAEDAFATFNDAPRDAETTELARQYR
jgi:hypothetical protein